MSMEGQKFYPGEHVSPMDLIKLANEYRRAAEELLPTGRRRKPLSRSPYRLIAIHAIELYLNAFLLAQGQTPAQVRGLQHNLAERNRRCVKLHLKLKPLTAKHLHRLTETREYLLARYETESSVKLSELNRLTSTLVEVADQVSAAVSRA